mmetsp:Transcript_274/g.834  ORF Transcript_274/g.834 Transcript_274/m.834 type:complete len:278 (-) Transcript_274:698-1531(-)
MCTSASCARKGHRRRNSTAPNSPTSRAATSSAPAPSTRMHPARSPRSLWSLSPTPTGRASGCRSGGCGRSSRPPLRCPRLPTSSPTPWGPRVAPSRKSAAGGSRQRSTTCAVVEAGSKLGGEATSAAWRPRRRTALPRGAATASGRPCAPPPPRRGRRRRSGTKQSARTPTKLPRAAMATGHAPQMSHGATGRTPRGPRRQRRAPPLRRPVRASGRRSSPSRRARSSLSIGRPPAMPCASSSRRGARTRAALSARYCRPPPVAPPVARRRRCPSWCP